MRGVVGETTSTHACIDYTRANNYLYGSSAKQSGIAVFRTAYRIRQGATKGWCKLSKKLDSYLSHRAEFGVRQLNLV
jgi:hypothetical protein